jgi:hypothetical protein
VRVMADTYWCRLLSGVPAVAKNVVWPAFLTMLLVPGCCHASGLPLLADPPPPTGLSQTLEPQKTHISNYRSGTPFYVSPEVSRWCWQPGEDVKWGVLGKQTGGLTPLGWFT